jgi:hypothetical protein
MNEDLSGAKQKGCNASFWLLLLLLGGTLAVLCREGFQPYEVFWANDLSLGALMESSSRLPGAIFACWADFWWIGGPNVAFPPNLTNICMAILSPEHHLKFYVPLSMFFLGFGAWFLFRQLRFSKMACVIGGLGAGLNMHFFSNACWGLPQWCTCAALIFIALGVLVSPHIEKLWIKGVLAGLATGMAVMEGFDVGAILSIYVAAFVVFRFLSTESDPANGARKTVYVGAVLVGSAFLISWSTIHTLIGTQISGTAGVGQSEAEKRDAWDKNTQWSIPKLETLRMIIPGLYGYRLDMYTTSTNPSAYYWGSIAEDPHIVELESADPVVRSNAIATLGLPADAQFQIRSILSGHDKVQQESVMDFVKSQPAMQRRHTGNGEYTGVLVCLLALFGLANAARKVNSPYSTEERRAVLFWGGAALISMLAAWGRHGFLYAVIYQLPLVANFRNPMKYMHPLNISVIILSGYGLEVLCRQYLATAAQRTESFIREFLTSWKRFSAFEKWWAGGCAMALALAVVGYFNLDSSEPSLVHHLLHAGFADPAVPQQLHWDDKEIALQLHHEFKDSTAAQMARFSIGEVEWFIVYLAVSAGVLVCILGGAFSGRRAVWIWVILGVIMICDLSRADIPWIRYYNYKGTMSLNPVTDLLRHDPWEHRVNSRIWPSGGYLTPNLTQLCHWWLENDYPFNDIQSLEIDQDPRMALLELNYLNQFIVASDHDLWRATRLWQLTNTRYLLAGAEWAPGLNQLGEPKNSFRAVMRMTVVPKAGIAQAADAGDLTVQTNSDGPVALIEFTRALPRAKLYANWKNVDDATALQQLGSQSFDPEKVVLVATNTPVAQTPVKPEADPGTVKFSHYDSKDLILEADAKTPAVLLLNDRTGDYWNVWVDKKPGDVLRCNYIMRGVFVPAGHHIVEFRYQPPQHLLYISLTAFGLGIVLAGFVIVTHFTRKQETTPDPLSQRTASPGKS